MILTKKCLPRRTVLRGMGAAIALPLLDCMIPAATALANTAAKPVRRLGAIYVPNGIIMKSWTPASEGAGFELSPILSSLAPFRNRLLVLSGLTNQIVDTVADGGGAHTRASAAFLTGVCAKRTEGGDIELGISMDQLAAKELGKNSSIPSLQLTCEENNSMGTCETGFSCAYRNFSWSGPKTPLPMDVNPRTVFERLYGDIGSTDPRQRSSAALDKRSILDSVTREVVHLETGLGPRDRTKLNEYLEAVRDAELRIQNVEKQNQAAPLMQKPSGIPPVFRDHAHLMFDLLCLAFQSDLTRVFTFMLATENSDRPYPECGVPDPYHPLSHHGDDPEKMARVATLNAYHVQTTSYFLEKLRSMPDGDGSLLDHAMIVYGSGISDGNVHSHKNLPIMVLGGGDGRLKGNRHLRVPEETPLTNLHVTLLNKLGVSVERLGDSTGEVSGI